MALDLYLALALFVFVTSVTPGPNNVMLMASGLNFGFRRSLPHIWGVVLGCSLMMVLVGAGVGAVFERYPGLAAILKYAGAAYLAWLAWCIARAGPVESANATAPRPMTLLAACAFQWINPKAWVMAVGAVTAYAAVAGFPWNVVAIALIFLVVGAPCCVLWVLFGSAMRNVLGDPRAVRIFNVAMALLLVLSLLPALAEDWF